MDIGELVERMKRQTKPEDLLGESFQGYSEVYAVTNDIAVKVYKLLDLYTNNDKGKYRKSLEGNACWDHYVGNCLYKARLNVPKRFGLASVSFLDASMPEFLTADDSTEDTWYLFMQRIHAIPPKEWTGAEKKECGKQYNDQIKKAHDLGFEVVDSDVDHNTLFDRSQQKLYLIDFVRWKRTIRHH